MSIDPIMKSGLPVDVGLEKIVLAAVMRNAAENLNVAVELLEPADFSIEAHKILFEQICHMAEEGAKIDPITVAKALLEKGNLAGIGGMTYITELGNDLPVIYHLDSYCESLARKSVLRNAILCAHTGIQRLCDPSATLEDLEEFKATLAEIEDDSKKRKGGFRHIADVIHDPESGGSTEFLNPRIEQCGIPWPWAGVNEMIGFMTPGQVVCVSAGTGVGKTTLATQTALSAAGNGFPTGLLTLEMTAAEQAKKIIAQHGKACLSDWLRGKSSLQDRKKIVKSSTELMKAPLFFDDRDDVTPAMLRTAIDRMKIPLALVVVDYAQLMDSGVRDRSASREQHVAHISRSIKKLAKKFKCSFIVLSQLNDDGKTRESRALEHDATFHLKLERKPQGLFHLSTPKARFAAFGKHIELQLDGETGLFTELSAER
jgi:replicative DNA helicase